MTTPRSLSLWVATPTRTTASNTVCDHEMYPNFDAIKKAGVKFISINPQVTTTDEQMGSERVRIIPNTDTALFLAMSYHLYRTGKYSKAFISKATVA